MATLLYICILINQVASIKVDVHRDKPRAVILFVGRSLASRLDATHDSSTIFDLMTGEEEDDSFGRQLSDSSSSSRASYSSGSDSLVEMLIEPVQKTHTVDVFICIDRAIGHVPAVVTQVFEISASSQEQRGAKCVSKLKEGNDRQYDWLIKARSDFVFFKQFPVMTSFEAGYVYTRFRAIAGVTGLTSDHISWCPCSQSCAGGPVGHVGYVNDDMVRVVPGDLMDFAFLGPTSHSSVTWDGKPLLHMPKNWVDMIGKEGELTRFWIERGILTKPLACPGYPKHDRYGQHDKSSKCAVTPVERVSCPPNVTIESAHRTLFTGNPSANSRF